MATVISLACESFVIPPFSTSVFTHGLLKQSADVRQMWNTGSRPAQTVDGGFLLSRCTTCFTLVWHSKQAEIILQTTLRWKNWKQIRRLFSRRPGCVLVSFLIGESKGDGLTPAFISTFRLWWTRARLYAGMCWSWKYVTDGAISDSLVWDLCWACASWLTEKCALCCTQMVILILSTLYSWLLRRPRKVPPAHQDRWICLRGLTSLTRRGWTII